MLCPSEDICLDAACTPTAVGDRYACVDGCIQKTAFHGCIQAESDSRCGLIGEVCEPCPAGQTCAQGRCRLPPSDGGVGSACALDSDCLGPPGDPLFCRHGTDSPSGFYPGGFCTRRCSGQACPEGSACITPEAESSGVCAPYCPTQGCRSGYACFAMAEGATDGVCWIAYPPGSGITSGPRTIGAPCTLDAQCASGSFCFPEYPEPPIGATGFVGGACAKTCYSSGLNCPAGSVCIGETFAGWDFPWMCRQSCANPGAGQSTCRAGYVCRQVSGTTSGQGYCAPSCQNVGGRCPWGKTCGSNGLCQ